MGKQTLVSNQKPRITFSLVIGVAMAVFGSAFQFGYNIAVMNAPTTEIQDTFFPCDNRTFNDSGCSEDEQTDRDNKYALAVSAFPFAGMFGSLAVSFVVQKFGRRGGLMVNNVISLVAAVFFVLSKYVGSFNLLIIGRGFIGLFAGLATGIVPMYISEISPKEWRGAIGVLNQLLITIGILIAQVFGLRVILGSEDMWPLLFGFTFLPSLVQSLSFFFMPRSPRYLLIDLHQEDAARNQLVKLRGYDDVSADMDEMRAEAEASRKTQALSIFQLIGERSCRWQLITVIAMMVAQQLSGINAVFFYANKIFELAGIPPGNPQDLAAIAVGAVNVIMTIVSVVLIERAGRKRLLVWGFGAMIFWCLALTVVLNLLLSFAKDKYLPYISIGCVIGYIVGFAVGPGPVPWLITAEFFTQEARPAATMIACVFNWVCNFIIGISFPAIAKGLGAYSFLLFMAVCVTITVYLYFVMPETRNKTFGEISAMFAKRNGVTVNSGDEQSVPLKQMNSRQDEV